jgi:hypothetical protein
MNKVIKCLIMLSVLSLQIAAEELPEVALFGPSKLPNKELVRYYLITKQNNGDKTCIASIVSNQGKMFIETVFCRRSPEGIRAIYTWNKSGLDNDFGAVVYNDKEGKLILDTAILLKFEQIDGVIKVTIEKIDLKKNSDIALKVLQAGQIMNPC